MNQAPLKIYSSKDWLIENHKIILMLAPYWGFKEVSSSDPDFGRFNEYLRVGKDIFDLVDSIEESEIAVYPQEYSNTAEGFEHLKKYSTYVKTKNKLLLVFYNADDDSEIKIDNCILFRTSFYKSLQKSNEFALPGWSVDFEKYFSEGKFKIIEPQKTPSVSYCGYIDDEAKGIKDRIKSILKPKKETHEDRAKVTRGRACRQLQSNKEIQTNFIIRNGFWAQGMEDKSAARKQYAENMIGSLYCIATRGGGNFSYRLYEILSCGRIPIFINTDSVLPFDLNIDWKKHVVWIEKDELNSIDSLLLKFHTSKTREELCLLQESNRKLYEEFISPIGFHKTLVEFLRNKLS